MHCCLVQLLSHEEGFRKVGKVSLIISCLSSPGSFLCDLAKISEKGVTNLLCVANFH